MSAPAPVTDLAPPLLLPDGSVVRRVGDGAVIVDPEGHVVVRYASGTATVVAAAGDLVLEAPNGGVSIRSRDAITLETEGRLRQDAGEIEVRAKIAHLTLGAAAVFARRLETTATSCATRVEQYELDASRIVETATDVLREARELMQTRAGRLRTLVRDVATLASRRTVLRSEDDTTIDGKRILLG